VPIRYVPSSLYADLNFEGCLVLNALELVAFRYSLVRSDWNGTGCAVQIWSFNQASWLVRILWHFSLYKENSRFFEIFTQKI